MVINTITVISFWTEAKPIKLYPQGRSQTSLYNRARMWRTQYTWQLRNDLRVTSRKKTLQLREPAVRVELQPTEL